MSGGRWGARKGAVKAPVKPWSIPGQRMVKPHRFFLTYSSFSLSRLTGWLPANWGPPPEEALGGGAPGGVRWSWGLWGGGAREWGGCFPGVPFARGRYKACHPPATCMLQFADGAPAAPAGSPARPVANT